MQNLRKKMMTREFYWPKKGKSLIGLCVLLALLLYYEYGYRRPKEAATFQADLLELHNNIDRAEAELRKKLPTLKGNEKSASEAVLQGIVDYKNKHRSNEKPNHPKK